MNIHFEKFTAVSVSVILIAVSVVGCAEMRNHPKLAVKEVMEQGFKGDQSMIKRVLSGQGSSADHQLLVSLTRELTLNTPSRGESTSWHDKTAALYAAAQSVATGQAGGMDSLKAAANCKACHSAHKPESSTK